MPVGAVVAYLAMRGRSLRTMVCPCQLRAELHLSGLEVEKYSQLALKPH